LEEAKGRDQRASGRFPPIAGYDSDHLAIRAALDNVQRAGLAGLVHFEKRELRDCQPLTTKYEATSDTAGIFVVNPPYGERLGDEHTLQPLYQAIGDVLKQRFKGWTGYVLTGNFELAKAIRLSPKRRHVLFNGPIECRLFSYPIDTADKPVHTAHRQEGTGDGAAGPPKPRFSPGAEMFANRLRKNLKNFGKWAAREGVTCYRVYDGDLPEYAVAVDLYEKWVHVQEYAPPKTVDPKAAEARLRDVMSVIPEVMGVMRSDVVLKVRRRQKGVSQYEKVGQLHEFLEVHEGGHKFLVNLRDYLDTGLFLDHRNTRKLIGELAKGRRFLNLFAYTGTASVYATKGGAASTTTVDMSNTYIDWAKRNFEVNGIRGSRHEFIRDDCLQWIPEQRDRWGLIFLDVPTFSKSKKMEDVFDVQRDHVWLLRETARLLEGDGILLFSNNFRRFKMDRDALPELEIEDITQKSIPHDFARNPRIHNCWRIRRKG
ncbi:MAG: bifunctional 23S rRNA (guanine(2069)-N(7))-methyltransferase RlmK/23S rRNA (guanine(2445)-N(2))-methyltransferase RlmL, partial [Myxococcales bacterium]